MKMPRDIGPVHFVGIGGAGMSGKPSSTIAFEKRWNALLSRSKQDFVDAIAEQEAAVEGRYFRLVRRDEDAVEPCLLCHACGIRRFGVGSQRQGGLFRTTGCCPEPW